MWPKYSRIPKLLYFSLRLTCSQIWLSPLLDDSSDLLSHKIKLRKKRKEWSKVAKLFGEFFFVVKILRTFFSVVNSTNFVIFLEKIFYQIFHIT
jgi:hypothetical protein